MRFSLEVIEKKCFTNKTIETVGQLKKLLERFPDNKPIIIDDEGDTWSPNFYNWAEDKYDDDCKWPIAIR